LEDGEGTPLPLSIQLAAELAMGGAAMHADALQTDAIQLVVLARNLSRRLDPSCSAWIASHWRKGGRRALVLRAASTPKRRPIGTRSVGHPCLAAIVRIEFPDKFSKAHEGLFNRVASRLAGYRHTPLATPQWADDAILIGYRTAMEAADAIFVTLRNSDLPNLRIAGHYGIFERKKDFFTPACYLTGASMQVLRQAIPSTPCGAFYVTEDFAACLHVAGSGRHTEPVGELPTGDSNDPIRLFLLQ
jgi:hypothetical protein